MNIDYNQRFWYSGFKNPEPYPKFQQTFLVKNNWRFKRTENCQTLVQTLCPPNRNEVRDIVEQQNFHISGKYEPKLHWRKCKLRYLPVQDPGEWLVPFETEKQSFPVLLCPSDKKQGWTTMPKHTPLNVLPNICSLFMPLPLD